VSTLSRKFYLNLLKTRMQRLAFKNVGKVIAVCRLTHLRLGRSICHRSETKSQVQEKPFPKRKETRELNREFLLLSNSLTFTCYLKASDADSAEAVVSLLVAWASA
jgi:hypothetical protein